MESSGGGSSSSSGSSCSSSSRSAWQELRLGDEAGPVQHLACFPLATTQQLVVKGLSIQAPPCARTAADANQQLAAQCRAIAAVAGMPGLQWNGKVVIVTRPMGC